MQERCRERRRIFPASHKRVKRREIKREGDEEERGTICIGQENCGARSERKGGEDEELEDEEDVEEKEEEEEEEEEEESQERQKRESRV
ncbi:hypothetical protein ALC53_03856 [Atta colombica]|uniref:Uncharacterized protein n=1 Tax=Atta colombica TaxID=520822 RepID=A0A195BNC9_9HYME|nr:hypothetical protein ALC53_03856 [Atta colombica]